MKRDTRESKIRRDAIKRSVELPRGFTCFVWKPKHATGAGWLSQVVPGACRRSQRDTDSHCRESTHSTRLSRYTRDEDPAVNGDGALFNAFLCLRVSIVPAGREDDARSASRRRNKTLLLRETSRFLIKELRGRVSNRLLYSLSLSPNSFDSPSTFYNFSRDVPVEEGVRVVARVTVKSDAFCCLLCTLCYCRLERGWSDDSNS